jgi:hypothetical protein
MRLIGWLLLACVAVAALKLAIIALLIAFGISLLWSTIHHPKEALGFVALGAIVGVTKVNPLVCLLAFGLAALMLSPRD